MADNLGGDDGSNDSFDISSILSPSTSANADTTGAGGAGTGEAQDQGSSAFKWGGKDYKSRTEAEQAHNKLYGKYSEQQSTFNQLKEALKNPKLFAQFSKDPAFAPILAKLGIQQQDQEIEGEIEEASGQSAQSYEQLSQDISVKMASFDLKQERWDFEQKLGRRLKQEEVGPVMNLIEKAPSLTIEQAWKLVNHDRLMKEAAEKAVKAGKPSINRPPPTALNVPGVKLDTKKNVGDMNSAEWREHLRTSPEFQNLFSNGK